MLETATIATHILIVKPDGDTHHWLLPLPRAEAAANALTQAEHLFPSFQRELHWCRVFGDLWAIVFVSARRQPPLPAAADTRPRYLPDPDN